MDLSARGGLDLVVQPRAAGAARPARGERHRDGSGSVPTRRALLAADVVLPSEAGPAPTDHLGARFLARPLLLLGPHPRTLEAEFSYWRF